MRENIIPISEAISDHGVRQFLDNLGGSLEKWDYPFERCGGFVLDGKELIFRLVLQ